MKFKDLITGNFSHSFFKNKLSIILLTEFLGTLFIAWLLRPVWVSPDWFYTPFQEYISMLGYGRMMGNLGAWVFLVGFCLFTVIGSIWNLYIFQQFRKENLLYALLLAVCFEFSLICVSLVGIFDGAWPNPGLSMAMHIFGAMYAFIGNVLSALILFIGISVVYIRNPDKRGDLAHPWKFFLIIVELVVVLMIFMNYGDPFWQWCIMLSLMTFIVANSLLFPGNLGKK
ncbi:MAG: hypothetical protein GY870_19385 [archaeon]|nr:hypothetical protein [archaeon]